MNLRRYVFHLFACLLLLTVVYACATTPRGRLAYGGGVAKQFTSATIIPDHIYYYYGRQSSPTTIIALNKQYQLQSRLWTQLHNPDAHLAEMIAGTRYQRNLSCTFSGATIIAPDGTDAGYWYSKWQMTSIRTPEPGVIEVYPPIEPTSGPCQERSYSKD